MRVALICIDKPEYLEVRKANREAQPKGRRARGGSPAQGRQCRNRPAERVRDA